MSTAELRVVATVKKTKELATSAHRCVPFSHAAPTGFIAVQHRLARQLPLQFLAGLRQRLAAFLDQFPRAAQTHLDAECRRRQLLHSPARNPRSHRQIGDQTGQTRSERRGPYGSGKFGPGGLPAVWASHFLALIPGDMRSHRRQFGDLIAVDILHRRGMVEFLRQKVDAVAAIDGKHGNDLIDELRRH